MEGFLYLLFDLISYCLPQLSIAVTVLKSKYLVIRKEVLVDPIPIIAKQLHFKILSIEPLHSLSMTGGAFFSYLMKIYVGIEGKLNTQFFSLITSSDPSEQSLTPSQRRDAK